MIKKALFLSCMMLQIIHASEDPAKDRTKSTVMACILSEKYATDILRAKLAALVQGLNTRVAQAALVNPVKGRLARLSDFLIPSSDFRDDSEIRLQPLNPETAAVLEFLVKIHEQLNTLLAKLPTEYSNHLPLNPDAQWQEQTLRNTIAQLHNQSEALQSPAHPTELGQYVGTEIIQNTIAACIRTELFAKNTQSQTLLKSIRDLNREFARALFSQSIPDDYRFPAMIHLSTSDIRPKNEVLSIFFHLHPQLIKWAKIVIELTNLPPSKPQTEDKVSINWQFINLKKYVDTPFSQTDQLTKQ